MSSINTTQADSVDKKDSHSHMDEYGSDDFDIMLDAPDDGDLLDPEELMLSGDRPVESGFAAYRMRRGTSMNVAAIVRRVAKDMFYSRRPRKRRSWKPNTLLTQS